MPNITNSFTKTKTPVQENRTADMPI
uniref:Uncharacterized protein n=1 Tax=Arundo donax TaxID=35708 RepID=A0A0A9AWQ4_ARUDO